MRKYQLTDPVSGKTRVIQAEGDLSPDDLDDISAQLFPKATATPTAKAPTASSQSRFTDSYAPVTSSTPAPKPKATGFLTGPDGKPYSAPPPMNPDVQQGQDFAAKNTVLLSEPSSGALMSTAMLGAGSSIGGVSAAAKSLQGLRTYAAANGLSELAGSGGGTEGKEIFARHAAKSATPLATGVAIAKLVGRYTKNPVLIIGSMVAAGLETDVAQEAFIKFVQGRETNDKENTRDAELSQKYPLSALLGSQIPAIAMFKPSLPFSKQGLTMGALNTAIGAGTRALTGSPQDLGASAADFAGGAIFSGGETPLGERVLSGIPGPPDVNPSLVRSEVGRRVTTGGATQVRKPASMLDLLKPPVPSVPDLVTTAGKQPIRTADALEAGKQMLHDQGHSDVPTVETPSPLDATTTTTPNPVQPPTPDVFAQALEAARQKAAAQEAKPEPARSGAEESTQETAKSEQVATLEKSAQEPTPLDAEIDLLTAQTTKLRQIWDQSTQTPGAFVTGRSNRPESLNKSLDAENNRKADAYKEWTAKNDRLEELTRRRDAFRRGEVHANGQPKADAPSKATVGTAQELYRSFLKERLKVGDQVAIPGGNRVTVKRINNVTVTTDGGVQWKYADLAPVGEKGPLSPSEVKEAFKAWREGTSVQNSASKSPIPEEKAPKTAVPVQKDDTETPTVAKPKTPRIKLSDVKTAEKAYAFAHQSSANPDIDAGVTRAWGKWHDLKTAYETQQKTVAVAAPHNEDVGIPTDGKTGKPLTLDEQEQQVRDEITNLHKAKGDTTLGAGLGGLQDFLDHPDLYRAYVKLGRIKIQKGFDNFQTFSHEIIREFGEQVRPKLRQLFQDSLSDYNDHLSRVSKKISGDRNVAAFEDIEQFRAPDGKFYAIPVHGDTAGVHHYVAEDGTKLEQHGGQQYGNRDSTYGDVVWSSSGKQQDEQIRKASEITNGLGVMHAGSPETVLTSLHGAQAYIAEINAAIKMGKTTEEKALTTLQYVFAKEDLPRPTSINQAGDILTGKSFEGRGRVLRQLGTDLNTKLLGIPTKERIIEKIVDPHLIGHKTGDVTGFGYFEPHSSTARQAGVKEHPSYQLVNPGVFLGRSLNRIPLHELAASDYNRWYTAESGRYNKWTSLSKEQQLQHIQQIEDAPSKSAKERIAEKSGVRMKAPVPENWYRSLNLSKRHVELDEHVIRKALAGEQSGQGGTNDSTERHSSGLRGQPRNGDDDESVGTGEPSQGLGQSPAPHHAQSKPGLLTNATDAAKSRIASRKKAKGDSGTLGTGLGGASDFLENLPDYAIIGAAHIRDGARSSAEFAKAMIGEFGEAIRPHLDAIEAEARKVHAHYFPEQGKVKETASAGQKTTVDTAPATKTVTPEPPKETAPNPAPVETKTEPIAEAPPAVPTTPKEQVRQLKMADMETEAQRLGTSLPDRSAFKTTWEQDRHEAETHFDQLLADVRTTPQRSAGQLTRAHRIAAFTYLKHIEEVVQPSLIKGIETAEAAGSTAEANQLRDQLTSTIDQYSDLSNKLYFAGSEAGRDLNLQRIFQGASLDVGAWIKKAMTLKGRDLSLEATRTITEMVTKAARVKTRIDAARDAGANAAEQRLMTRPKHVPKVFSEANDKEALSFLRSVDFEAEMKKLDTANCP